MTFDTPDAFEAAVAAPPEADPSQALWFLFKGPQLLVRPDDARAHLPSASAAAQVEPAHRLYLGRLRGRHVYAAELPARAEPDDGHVTQGLRALFGRLDDELFALAGRAVQLVDWNRTHRYCGACGTPTALRASERSRECPSCKLVAYPRVAPAIMALVRDGQRILLARSPHFAPGMYSALAGFVEPGESLEQCLVREVREEVGVEVARPRYFGSQSWPFPHSMMIAFVADYAGGEISPDPAEIEDAGWFDLHHLPPQLPGKISISRRLIDAVLADIAQEPPAS
jgi:NAD+ diphosphatase